MPPLKVLHLDSEATWRGGEQQVAYLLHGLAERGVCNLLAAPPGSVLLARVPARDAKPCPLPLRAEWDIVSALRLARLIRRERPRLIHAHTAKAHTMAVVGRLLSRQRLPVVVSRRVCFPIQAHWFNNWKYQEADFYLPISHAIEAVLHEFGIPPERTEVVYSCIDPARFDGQSAEGLREEFGIPAEAVVIGNVAVCEALKDQATLIRAAARVMAVQPDVHVVIVGDGPLRAELQSLAAALGVADRVHLPGFRTDVPRLLRLFSLFVMVPRMEGLGSAILEAEANALPVLATPVGGIPEIVRDGVNGFLVPVGDAEALEQALLRLTRSPSLRAQMGKESYRLLIESFTVDKMIENTLAIYHRMKE